MRAEPRMALKVTLDGISNRTQATSSRVPIIIWSSGSIPSSVKKLDGFRMAAEFKVQGLALFDNGDELGDPIESNVEFGVHFLMAIGFEVGVGQAG